MNLALIAEVPKYPALAAVRDEAAEALLGLCRLVVSTLNPDIDGQLQEKQARRVHALVDGLALHILVQPLEADPSWALDLLREELESLRRS